MAERVHVIAATGRSGLALCAALQAHGITAVAVVRDAAKAAALGLAEARVADLANPPALAAALADATHVVCTAHARHAAAVIAAAPPAARLVLMGSTRRFSKWPDAHGSGVIAGEAAFLASGRQGVMLHPTMIYGAEGENNVRRLVAVMRRLPLLPLPAGGRNLVQPIHQDDVTACLRAAIARPWPGPCTAIIAGPRPVTYADFVRAVAAAAGLKPPRILPVPAWLLMAASPLTLLPILPRIRPAEIRRLLEDKDFPQAETTTTLGVTPMGLEEGLARSFA
ncbi:MAG: NAD(P)H-binding protein [Acetobacteraceae bacterium]|nr:NAD(P)H-binding protein [Acetobacteraceae bacterium]